MEYTIEKFKVKDGFPTVTYKQELNENYVSIEATFYQLIHPDLSHMLDRLTVHLCLLTELVSEQSLFDLGNLQMALNGEAIYEHLAFSSFRCSGFTLSSDGVVLIGRKTLASKKVVNLVTPFALLNEDSDYEYSDHLEREIDGCLEEIKLLLQGKFREQQLDLFNQPEPQQLALFEKETAA